MDHADPLLKSVLAAEERRRQALLSACERGQVQWRRSDGKPYEVSRLPRLSQMIHKTLAGEIRPREAFRDRDKVKKREREFRFPTHIVFDNEGSEIYTIIEVDTRDRPGLLYRVARQLAEYNLNLYSAKIKLATKKNALKGGTFNGAVTNAKIADTTRQEVDRFRV